MNRARVAQVLAAGRQYGTSPHVQPSHGTPTRSPARIAPATSTVPTIWWPGTSGSFGVGQLAVDDVQVGAADPAGVHAEQHLSRAGLRLGELGRPQRAPGASSTIAPRRKCK